MDEELKTARTNADVDAVLKRFNVALSDMRAVITKKKIAYCELITYSTNICEIQSDRNTRTIS